MLRHRRPPIQTRAPYLPLRDHQASSSIIRQCWPPIQTLANDHISHNIAARPHVHSAHHSAHHTIRARRGGLTRFLAHCARRDVAPAATARAASATGLRPRCNVSDAATNNAPRRLAHRDCYMLGLVCLPLRRPACTPSQAPTCGNIRPDLLAERNSLSSHDPPGLPAVAVAQVPRITFTTQRQHGAVIQAQV
jgi:hypothetical protein